MSEDEEGEESKKENEDDKNDDEFTVDTASKKKVTMPTDKRQRTE